MKAKSAITTIRPASLGSISHGTLRTVDLLESFFAELEHHVFLNGAYFSALENFAERNSLARILGEAQDCFAENGEGIDPEKEDIAEEMVNESLPDALQRFAKPYCYFGAHYGDEADFGFWPLHDEIDELPTVEDSDEARKLGEDCKSVNDHGNVTVYGGDGSVLLELV